MKIIVVLLDITRIYGISCDNQYKIYKDTI